MARSNSPPQIISVCSSDRSTPEHQFERNFSFGRGNDCDLRITTEGVSRQHGKVEFDGDCWWVIDFNSKNGVFINDRRINGRERLSLGDAEVRLGLGPTGPDFILKLVKAGQLREQAFPSVEEDLSSMTQIIHRVLQGKDDEQGSTRTMLMREAMREMAKRHTRRYQWLMAAGAIVMFIAGSYIWQQHHRLVKMQDIAADIFYGVKQLEVQTASMENTLGGSARPTQLVANRARIKELEQQYERYMEINKIGAYESSLSEQERLVFRIARLFGECDVDMPRDFLDTVMKYVRAWQSTDRLTTAMQRAKAAGYIERVSATMLAEDLPPQFFYLALQESGFNPRAVGPPTYAGIAKGIWQFIPTTAAEYGLRTGPLVQLARYDPADERYDFDKATRAAARYLKRIYATDAQASGLLVMASYNWGEGKVIRLINKLPPNPRERNFWKLLKYHRSSIPDETYNYVLYIFSAAVIGENPKLFGFSFKNPYEGLR